MARAIERDDESGVELERRAARTLPYRVVVRAKRVLLAADGRTNREIAERVDMSADRVGGWRRRFAARGIEGLEDQPQSAPPRRFPPQEVAQVKAIACELPQTHGVALSRYSRSELHRFLHRAGHDRRAGVNDRALAGRGRDQALQRRSWIFPRDPGFLERARVLDLHQGRWAGKLLEPGDTALSADTKPSTQARRHIHEPAPPAPGRGQRVEHEDERTGALTSLHAWDVRRGGVIGRSEPKGNRTVRPARLASHDQGAHASARRVFWIVDNGSDHQHDRDRTPIPLAACPPRNLRRAA